MAKRRTGRRFASLWDAVVEGSTDDVRRALAAGHPVDERDEEGDPTPLMYAAARGRLDVVRVLVAAGADVNVVAEDLLDLPPLPFLEPLYESATLWGMSALAYAAGYGRDAVCDFLAPRTSATLRRQANAVRRARAAYLDALDPEARAAFEQRLLGEKPAPSARAAARTALLRAHPKLARWVVQCPLCQRQGFKPALPADTDPRGPVAALRRLFKPLALRKDGMCEACAQRAARAMRRREEQRQRKLASLPPELKAKLRGMPHMKPASES
jgi:Ankyrin repeats (many copies)